MPLQQELSRPSNVMKNISQVETSQPEMSCSLKTKELCLQNLSASALVLLVCGCCSSCVANRAQPPTHSPTHSAALKPSPPRPEPLSSSCAVPKMHLGQTPRGCGALPCRYWPDGQGVSHRAWGCGRLHPQSSPSQSCGSKQHTPTQSVPVASAVLCSLPSALRSYGSEGHAHDVESTLKLDPPTATVIQRKAALCGMVLPGAP